MTTSAPGNADKHGVALAARFAEAPHVAVSTTADQRLRDWLAELDPQAAAAVEAQLVHPFARDILAGIADFSPYLFELVRADAARFARLLQSDPDAHLAGLIE